MSRSSEPSAPRRRLRRGLLLGGALLALLGGVAVASIPDSSGVFHGCVDGSGKLRLVDTSKTGSKCTKQETAVSWGGPAASSSAMSWRGDWDANTSYVENDVVRYNGTAWVSLSHGSGVAPGTPKCPKACFTAPWTPLVAAAAAPPPSGGGGAAALPTYTWTQNSRSVGLAQQVIAHLSLAPGRYALLATVGALTLDGSDQTAHCSLAVGFGTAVTATLDDITVRVPSGEGADRAAFSLQGGVYFDREGGFADVRCSLYRGTFGAKLSAQQVGSITQQ